MDARPDREWWTADELAAAGLPDMPGTKRRVNALAERFSWRGQTGLARRRAGRGGGWEYHWTLFPARAQRALIARAAAVAMAAAAPVPPAVPDRDGAWAAYERASDDARARAKLRLASIQAVEAMEAGGSTRHLAVHLVARQHSVSPRSIWNWLAQVESVETADRLAHLVGRHAVAERKPTMTECDPKFMDVLKSDYLRFAAPSFSSAYRRAVKLATQNGWSVLTEATARRRLDREVSEPAQVYARKGLDALKRMYPAQTRDRRALEPMEAVNADFHKWDVFVRWSDGEIIRPQMVAFEDIFSGRVLSWRVDRTPNKATVGLALGDMIERFGIPQHMLLDNGREFANKWLTGQTETRNRFQIKDDDIQGVLVTLGVTIHWATPYSGQSKHIERTFRDMADAIAKDPRFDGAYTGNRPDAKPEDYGARAIDLETFLRVVGEGIEEHNTRTGRRSDTARGRSLAETFDAAYATTPIRKATAEQQRLWLMGAEGLRPNRTTGQISFMGNKYWSPWLHDVAGKKVIARFDPADLWAGLHIYGLDGRYLGRVDCQEKSGHFDVAEGSAHNKARRQWMKAEKAAAEAHRKYRAADLGQLLDAAAPPPVEPVEAKVIQPLFGQRPVPKPAADAAAEAAHEALIADFGQARAARTVPEDEALERFRAALELEARLAEGEAIRPEQQRWLTGYQGQPEYQAYRQMMETHGAEIFG